jgi:hypothetical protein
VIIPSYWAPAGVCIGMENHNNTFGSIVISTWVNSVLLMIETIQLAHCLARQRRLGIKLLAVGCYAVDLVCSTAICAAVYLYIVTHWGDKLYSKQDWPIPVEMTSTAVVSLCVQIFLIQRYYCLSRNLYLSSVLILLVLIATAGAVTTGVIAIMYRPLSERYRMTGPVMAWLVTTSVADWAIAASLVWELQKRRSTVKVKRTRKRALTPIPQLHQETQNM